MKILSLLLGLILLASCQSKTSKYLDVTLHTEKEVVLEPSARGNSVLTVSSAQFLKDKILLSDLPFARQVFLYSLEGKLLSTVGSIGEGPGEYAMAGGVGADNHTILVGGGSRLLHVYDAEGTFQRKVQIPWLKEPTSLVVDGNDLFGAAFSRYVPFTIHHLNATTGETVQSFSESDDDYKKGFDNYHPYGGLFHHQGELVQFFNHRYELLFWSKEGRLLRTVELKSRKYQPPKYKEIPVKDERKFRESFTLFGAAFPFNGGMVTMLHQKTGDKDSFFWLEFWDETYEYIGSWKSSSDEEFIGVQDGYLVFFTADPASKLIYRKPLLGSREL